MLRGVGHVYSRNTPWAHRALTDVNLRIDKGEAVLVVGHNGSGKSTLAWVLAGLLDPSEGEARLEGQPLSTRRRAGRRRVPALAPATPAADGARRGERRRRARRTRSCGSRCADVGFDPSVIGPRRVDELSGGEARRVVIAGALAARPRALVLDEPFAGPRRPCPRATSARRSCACAPSAGMTLVCVSHDRDLPPALVDREIELDGRPHHLRRARAATDDHDIAQGNRP